MVDSSLHAQQRAVRTVGRVMSLLMTIKTFDVLQIPLRLLNLSFMRLALSWPRHLLVTIFRYVTQVFAPVTAHRLRLPLVKSLLNFAFRLPHLALPPCKQVIVSELHGLPFRWSLAFSPSPRFGHLQEGY